MPGSIGIAVGPDHGQDPELLLQRADVAMYQAKKDHSGIEVSAPECDQYSPRRLALVGALRTAIEQRELTLLYQPKIELASRRIVGVEALLLWHHPEHGQVPPDEFIPSLSRPPSSSPSATSSSKPPSTRLAAGTRTACPWAWPSTCRSATCSSRPWSTWSPG